MKKVFFMVFGLIIFNSCSKPINVKISEIPKTENRDSLSVYYTNKGSEYFIMRNMPDSAIVFFDKAIAYDKTNLAAYNNKFQILISRKDYQGALELMKAYEEVDRDYYPVLGHIGILSEKINDSTIDEKKYYQRALNLLDEEIKTEKGDLLNLYVGKVSFLTLLNMKDSADKISDSLLIVYPDFREIILELKNSNRQDLLNAY